VERVVDSLRVGEEGASPQVYLKKGALLVRAIDDLFDADVSWEQYRAAKKRHRPA
jgi:hypothetical protein